MRCLGLDLATKTGWAVVEGPDDAEPRVGTWKLKGTDGEKGYQLGTLISSVLTTQKSSGSPIEVVAFEQNLFVPQNRSGIQAHALRFGLMMVAMVACESRLVPYMPVPTSTLKHHATGSGRAKKEDMMEAAHEATGRVLTPDEADAFWVAQYGSQSEVRR